MEHHDVVRCPACSFESPAGFRFCGGCGSRLVGPAPVREPSRTGLDGQTEKRLLSVLFCDLVGFTQLSERLPLEELRERVHSYQKTCVEVIEAYGGTVAQYLGDGLLVYFGYPRVQEDDARRATEAGLEIVAAIERSASGSSSLAPRVRIGIHTGLVVIGETGAGDHREQLAVGQTPNVAARLQALAEPNRVVTSEVTFELIKGSIRCESIGVHTLKGVSRPMEAFRAVSVVGQNRPLPAARPLDEAPMVGRRDELASLEEAWRLASRGSGRVVVVRGDAGIGKSRLIREFRGRLAESPHLELAAKCWSSRANSAFAPALELMESSPPDLRQSPAARDLGELLNPSSQEPITDQLSPEKLRQRILDTWVHWIMEHAAERPLLLCFEDVQWMDPSTQELVQSLRVRCEQRSLLVLLTCRGDLGPTWRRDGLSTVDLGRLDDDAAAELLRSSPGADRLSTETVRAVLSKAGGVPLFLLELARMLLDTRTATSADEIPTRLGEVLLARLDRLGAEKQLVRLAAVVGQRFDRRVLEAITPMDPVDLTNQLDALVDQGLLGHDANGQFSFTQELVQAAAYGTLVKHERQTCHRRIADAMSVSLPELSEQLPEVVANHYSRGALHREAFTFWHRAGQKAARRWANVETSHHLAQGLRSLRNLPASPARDFQELQLRTLQGPTVMATRGFAAPRVGRIYKRSYVLTNELRDDEHWFPVVWGLLRYHSVRGELAVARQLSFEVLEDIETKAGPSQRMMIHGLLGSTIFQMGEISEAYEHLRRAIELYEKDPHIPEAFLYALHPGINCLGYGSYALWHLGYPDQALERVDQMLGIARAEGQDALTLSFALCAAAVVHQFRREPEQTAEYANEALALASRESLALAGALARTLRGWAVSELGKTETGTEEIRSGLEAWVAAGTGIVQPHFLVLLAELQAKTGALQDARRTTDRALEISREAGEGYYQAEVHRIDGELRRATSPEDPRAGEAFRTAIEVALRQGSRSLALRAAISLADWQGSSGATNDDDHQLLTRLVADFGEDLESTDLREARMLLGSVGGPVGDVG